MIKKGNEFESHCVLGDVWCNGSILFMYLVKIPIKMTRGRGVVPCQVHALETWVRIPPPLLGKIISFHVLISFNTVYEIPFKTRLNTIPFLSCAAEA